MFFTRSKKYKLTQSLDLGMYAEVWDLNHSIYKLSISSKICNNLHEKELKPYIKRYSSYLLIVYIEKS